MYVRSVSVCMRVLCARGSSAVYQDAVFSPRLLCGSEENSNVININNRDFICADHRSGKIFGVSSRMQTHIKINVCSAAP